MKESRINQSETRLYWLITVVLMMVLLSSGCAKIRLITYPDNFVWLDQTEVKGLMHSMYQSMQRMDSLLESGDQTTDEEVQAQIQSDIISELQRLEIIAISLVAGIPSDTDNEFDSPVTNHLLIDEHMNDFIGEISQAKFRAEADPPRYFKVGQLIGECNACHRQR